ncbi:transcriptional regulator opi1 [Collariella sp. IMI 366227]|nr:transcriptional regulator opi1 [Collariella sp. IMI 366227]
MEQRHMPRAHRSPRALQPSDDIGPPTAELRQFTSPRALPADSPTIHPFPDRRRHEHEPSHPAPFTKPTNHWPSLNPFTAYYTPSYLDPAESSPSMGSEKGSSRRGTSVSLDDPDVRIAAEALGQMRTDCASSPHIRPHASTPGNRKSRRDYRTVSPSPQNKQDPEPLLSLITTSHPLLASAVGGAATAYNTGKNYSPQFKSGAEYVESCLKPVGKAVGTVSRKTGVEGGVRWIFGIRNKKQHSTTDIETGERGNGKRRKSDKARRALNASPLSLAADNDDRRMSISTVDTLPAYDDLRSPAYTEVADDKNPAGPGAGTLGQRFVVTTSGLGVAMRQESLRSLKYCLKVLKNTNGHVSEVLVNLKNLIEEYDLVAQKHGEDQEMEGGGTTGQNATADRLRLIQRMGELRDDIFSAIHRTVQTVSKYAGSALPENARNIVHRQLMSLPGLYQLHYIRESERRRENASPDTLARDSAHLAMLFAKEALQMMTQVGDVLNRTLMSAEEWCETLYRKKNESEQSASPSSTAEPLPASPLVPMVPMISMDRDVTMSG